MENQQKGQSALFDVYLRLRPAAVTNHLYPNLTAPDRFLAVEESKDDAPPTHITLNPPNDNRRRAVEKFAFTKVFEEGSTQLDIFQGTGVLPLVEGVLGHQGGEGQDGLLATLGVTGSGKTHTILGSRNQRGLTQLALDLLFRSISHNVLDPSTTISLHATVAASDPSEAQVMSAQMFLDTMYGDPSAASRASSRAPTPMVVRQPSNSALFHQTSMGLYPCLLVLGTGSPNSLRVAIDISERPTRQSRVSSSPKNVSYIPSFMRRTAAQSRRYYTRTNIILKGESNYPPPTPRRQLLQRPSTFPQLPDISNVTVDADPNAEYAILISMYEVYNDRIFDLLTPALPGKSTKDFRRRPLLFKPTEQSPDRKVVAGLRKIICGTVKEALMVLEAGLHERRVSGTGSNSVSSRSHGFFCVEVKRRRRCRMPGTWCGSALTIVDLAGSERARDAKTQGATLQEAGKINESLMYLGQCLQMQSDLGSSTKPNLVPFRQCKLTELLFSNSFPSSSSNQVTGLQTYQNPHAFHQHSHHQRNPQKAVMIVTADPLGDFNATSQILRYSALAREITVPRIPSVTSTILAASASSNYFGGSARAGARSPSDTERETMEIAALEIARMAEEIEGLRAELAAEQQRRMECEAHLETLHAGVEDRVLDVEHAVREECYQEMETTMEAQMRAWKASWAAETERNGEHLDRKVEILTRGISANEDNEDKENAPSGDGVNRGVLFENERLRREVEILKREMQLRSPTKKSAGGPLREIRGRSTIGSSNGRICENDGNLRGSQDRTSVSSVGAPDGEVKGQGSPLKRVRKLTARKWDLIDEDELL